jgi:hypothetical protein
VHATAVLRVADEPVPGWVEVHLELADGSMATLFDKPPIFEDGDLLLPDAEYPIDLWLECGVDGSFDAGPRAVRVVLRNGASDPSGAVAFSVPATNVSLGD